MNAGQGFNEVVLVLLFLTLDKYLILGIVPATLQTRETVMSSSFCRNLRKS